MNKLLSWEKGLEESHCCICATKTASCVKRQIWIHFDKIVPKPAKTMK